MSTSNEKKSLIPVSFSAGSIVHLLSAGACFLGSYVIPLTYPELALLSRNVLLTLGGIFLVVAIISIVFRRWLSLIAQRIGIRSRMLLPREGMVYLAIMLVIAIGALTGGNPDTGNMLLLVFGMMAGPFVLNGWVVVAMLAKTSATRVLPPTAPAGTFFSVEVILRNGRKFLASRLVEVRDVVEGHRLREEPSVTFVRVDPKEERSGNYELCISRRGLYQFGPLRISSRFPLGIGERGHIISEYNELVVHPALGRLLPGWKRRERELAESASRANARLGIFDDDFHSIREYRPGDNPRAIHWRSSGRHGQVMVKEHQQHREAELIVLLDLFQTREFTESLQEMAVSLAATLCVEQTRHASSGTYRLCVAGKELACLEITGAARFRDVALRSLAVCEASPKAPLAEMMMSVCQGTISSSSRYVLITPRPEAATLLSQAIARDSLKNETQLTGRLLILKADSQTLTEVFAPAELLTAPHADPSKLPTASTALHSQPLVPLVAESTAGGL
jgi:hypothetical protein